MPDDVINNGRYKQYRGRLFLPAPKNCSPPPGALLLGLLVVPLVVMGLLIGLASSAVAQAFPIQVGVGFKPTGAYIDLYYPLGQATTSVQFPAATGGTAPLTYSMAGRYESLGFAFDPATRTFSGTPTLAGAGSGSNGDGFEFTYRVDSASGSGFDTITVYATVCEAGGRASGATFCSPPAFTTPAVTAPPAQSYTAGTAVMPLVLPAATGGTGRTPLHLYALSPLPAGLMFNAATRTLSGTPTTAESTTVTYGVTDSASNTGGTPQTFTVTVSPAPVLGAVADRTYTKDTAITPVVLSAATGGSGTLSYTLTGLPAGLMFDPATRTLSGTPTTAESTTATYTVTDLNNGAVATRSLWWR